MLRTLCEEGFEGEIGFLNYARSRAARAVRPRAAQARPRPQAAAGRTRLHPRTRAAAQRALRSRAPVRRDLRPRRCGDVRLRPAGADRRGPRRLGRRTACPSRRSRRFTPPALRFDTDGAEGRVSFTVSGREAANSGLPLLEQAEDAGLAPDHGCRMGICNTCSCRKTAGTVRNVISGATLQPPGRSRSASACPCRSATSHSTSRTPTPTRSQP